MCWIYQEANDIQGGVSPTHFMQVLSVWADILKCFDTWIWSHAAKLQCYVLSYSLNKVFCFCFKQKKIKDSPALSPNHPALCCEVFCFLFSFLQIKENLPSSSKFINTWKGGQPRDPRRAQWHLGTSLPCPCHSHAFWTRFFPLPR